jgi:hypothetical protein
VFPTIEALVDSYMDPYVDGAGRVVGWGTAHLDALVRTDWRFSLRNVKSVERELIVMKHRRIRMAESRYRAALARFNDWKAAGRTITPRSMHTLYGPQTRSWL